MIEIYHNLIFIDRKINEQKITIEKLSKDVNE